MSMPSSSALVLMTPMTSRKRRPFDLAAQIRQITAAIAGDKMIVQRFGLDEFVFEILGQNFDMETTRGKNNGLNMVINQIRGKFARGRHRALANAQFAVNDGWIVENKCFGSGGRAAFIQERNATLQNFFRVFTWIGDGGRTADKYWIGAIETADSHQPADNVGEVRPENTSVDMQFIDDDIF